ncbi:unnamed protein product, partial [Polarella glacialis]
SSDCCIRSTVRSSSSSGPTCCRGLVATDYLFVEQGCGIWPTAESNMALLRTLGARVLDGVDAFLVEQRFPRAGLVIWAAPRCHVESSVADCSPSVTQWTSNDQFNLVVFEMLQQKLP